MKRISLAVIALFTVSIAVLSGCSQCILTGQKASVSYGASEDIDCVRSGMGAGINLGNDLDVCDWTYFGIDKKAEFQSAIVYNTSPWTVWDASQYCNFDDAGNLTIEWKLSDLKSSADATSDNFAIQLVNHNKEYEGTKVRCSVNSAVLTFPNGTTEQLKSGSDSYELTIKNDVTEFFYFDLKHLGIKTADLKGGIVSISIHISDYSSGVTSKITKLEKSWGNPAVTKEMIAAIKAAGFGTIRIPVTYFNHITPDGTIDKEFLDRVEQVADWALDSGLYCIIDVHHDTGNDGWIKASESNYNKNKELVAGIFRQISERFKNKSDHLILEGLNETVNDSNNWSNVPLTDLKVMNKWNQLFVDTVRSTGGRNSNRYLLVNTYAALSLDECLSAFELPDDKAENRIFVGIHCYYKADQMKKNFDVVSMYSQKYHFIIGEWAVWKKNENRQKTAAEFLSYTKELGIPTIWWDNGKLEETALFDRSKLDVAYPDVVKTLTE